MCDGKQRNQEVTSIFQRERTISHLDIKHILCELVSVRWWWYVNSWLTVMLLCFFHSHNDTGFNYAGFNLLIWSNNNKILGQYRTAVSFVSVCPQQWTILHKGPSFRHFYSTSQVRSFNVSLCQEIGSISTMFAIDLGGILWETVPATQHILSKDKKKG